MAADAQAVRSGTTRKRTKSTRGKGRGKAKATANPRRRASDFEADALRNEVLGIAVMAAALCLMLALASFHPEDVAPDGPAAATGLARNLIGPVGASLADVLLGIFGVAAFLLPVTLAVPGLCFMTGRRVRIRPTDAVGYPILVFCSAMAAHLWMDGRLVLGHDAGGLIGTHGAEILRALFGLTGAYIIIYAVIALTFVLTTRISIVRIFGRLGSPVAHRARTAADGAAETAVGLRSGMAERFSAWREGRHERRAEAEAEREARLAEREALREERRAEREALREERRAEREARRTAGKADKAEKGRGRPKGRSKTRPEPRDTRPTGTEEVVTVDEEDEDLERDSAAQPRRPLIRLPKFGRGGGRKGKREERPAAGPPDDSGGFTLGEPDASPSSDGFVIGDGTAAREAVHDATDLGVELADPLDRTALDGAGDTVIAASIDDGSVEAPAAVETPPEPAPSTAKPAPGQPVVKARKAKEKPEEEQIDIPLPELSRYEGYVKPPLRFLDYDDSDQVAVDPLFLQEQALKLTDALSTFKIEGRVTEIHPGPVVTMFEFEPAPGVRISKIAGLADDLAMALKAVKVRIVAPIPGKGVVGFEVPNKRREMVYLKEIIGSQAFRNKKINLPMALGKDIHGEAVVTDLAKMPHLLVAGTTGSGKSVGVNGMITSLLYHATPEEVRFIMVDPKMLELSIYEGVPHLLLPVVTDPKKASMALKWAVDEMERRYELMKNAGVRDLRGYNRKLEKQRAEAEAEILRAQAAAVEAQYDDEAAEPWSPLDDPDLPDLEDMPTKLPYIVVVIDEFADLMMVAGKEVEYCVARIAQKARAAGIHLILATQRPSTDVITGVIKANFPTRMAFQVSSAIDSRTILSTNGAENLLGKGDMLFMPPGTSRLTRVHGAFVSEEEIHQIVEFIGAQQEPDYLDESILDDPDEAGPADDDGGDMDPMYEEAVRVVARDGRASTSHLQRRLSLGYNRAARIVDQMERDGLVGPGRGAKPRQINKAVILELVERWDAT